MSQLRHPNIIRLYDSFVTPSDVCVVTEFAHGELFKICQEECRLSEELVGFIAGQLILALDYLHQHRVIHRDMKPQNILVGSNSLVKLVDFGFARAMSRNTMVVKSVKGTPLYMAPELASEKAYTHAVDLWSLGVIIYELYYAQHPFQSNSLVLLFNKITKEEVTYPPPISSDLKDLIGELLLKDPSLRLNWPNIHEHPYVKTYRPSLPTQEEDDLVWEDLVPKVGTLAQTPHFLADAHHWRRTPFGPPLVDQLGEALVYLLAASGPLQPPVDVVSVVDVVMKLPRLDHPHFLIECTLCLLLHLRAQGRKSEVDCVFLGFAQLLKHLVHIDGLLEVHQPPVPVVPLFLGTRQLPAGVLACFLWEVPKLALSSREITLSVCRFIFRRTRDDRSFGAAFTRGFLSQTLEFMVDQLGQPGYLGTLLILLEGLPLDRSHSREKLLAAWQTRETHRENLQVLAQKLCPKPGDWLPAGFLRGLKLVVPLLPEMPALLWPLIWRSWPRWLSDFRGGTRADFLNVCITLALEESPFRQPTDEFVFENPKADEWSPEDGEAPLSYLWAELWYLKGPPESGEFPLDFPGLNQAPPDVSGFNQLVGSRGLAEVPRHYLDGLLGLWTQDPRRECRDLQGLRLPPLGVLRVALSLPSNQDCVSLCLTLLQEFLGSRFALFNALASPESPTFVRVYSDTYRVPVLRGVYLVLDALSQALLSWTPPELDAKVIQFVLRGLTLFSPIREDFEEPTPGLVHSESREPILWAYLLHQMVVTLYVILQKFPPLSSEFVKCEGLTALLSRLDCLNPRRPQCLLLATLSLVSQVSRISKKYYPVLGQLSVCRLVVPLLTHDQASIRAKTCNLAGNLVRHSDFFYRDFQEAGVVSALMAAAQDESAHVRKFASFAIGNSLFHTHALCPLMSRGVTGLCALLEDEDEKTRSNAAGSLGNFVRNSGDLCGVLLAAGVLEKLEALVNWQTSADPQQPQNASRNALFSLGNFGIYPSTRQALRKMGVLSQCSKLIESAAHQDCDPTLLKFAQRLHKKAAAK